MLLDTAPCTDLPAPLLDAITENFTGLRQVVLRRGHGRKGYVATGTSWTLAGEASGDPTGHDETPNEDPEDIAREIVSAAIELVALGDGKERRFEAILRVATESGEVQKHPIGFELEEDAALHAPRGRLSLEGEMGALVRTLSTSLREAHQDVHRANGTLNANVREVGKTFREAMAFRMDAFEDHYHAALHGGGKRPTAGDDDWKKEASETAGKFIDAIAAAASGGGGSDEESKGGGSGESKKGRELRDALVSFGQTISDAQQGKLITAVGVSTMMLLRKAGKEDTDIAAAKLVHEFLRKLEGEGEKVSAILSAEQEKQLESVLKIYEPMISVVEKG